MKFISTEFEGVFLIENKSLKDNRGEFHKLFQKSLFWNYGLEINVDEHFFSVSQKGVIRGMHFQLPPFAQSKIVYVLQGKVTDVIVDLRRQSKTFKQFLTFNLDTINRKAVFLPAGLAHGFQSVEDNSIMVYLQSNEFDAPSDGGINPFSWGIDWPLKLNYTVSDKDINLTNLSDFISPF